MGRIVAIAGGDLTSNHSINQYIVEMVGKKVSNVLFIGTASHDAEGYIENIHREFEQLHCTVKELCLTVKEYTNDEVDALLAWADIIYVGGGNTAYMMEIWRKSGIDKKLKEVYFSDSAVLTGISAGAMCWFDCGHSDSEIFWKNDVVGYGWVNNLLSLHPFAFCSHYEERIDSFDEMIQEKTIPGLAMESDTAFVEQNGKIVYISSNSSARAYIVNAENGLVVKKQLVIQEV